MLVWFCTPTEDGMKLNYKSCNDITPLKRTLDHKFIGLLPPDLCYCICKFCKVTLKQRCIEIFLHTAKIFSVDGPIQ